MSNYPHAPPYGASSYPGQHQPNAPYTPTYPNHTYTQQTDSGYQGPSQYAQNYDASMNAYGYNQHSVPAFGTAPIPPPLPLPVFQGWNQDVTSLPTYTAPQNPMAYSNYAGQSYDSAPQYPPEEQQSYPQISQYSNLGDEGEVSAGEYDDNAYAPTNPSLVGYGTTQYQGSNGNGYMSTARRAAYTRTQNHSPLQTSQTKNDYYPRDTSHAVRQHSESYSQYNAAPRPADENDHSGASHNYKPYTSSHVSEQYLNGASLDQSQSVWKQNGSVDSPRPSSHPNRDHAIKSQDKSIQHILVSAASADSQSMLATDYVVPSPAQSTPTTKASNAKAGKTLAEALKEAQGAILNLYPFQIGYRDLVDEGINEDIVGRVFDDLGLAKSSAKSISDMPSGVSTTKHPSTAKSSQISGAEDTIAHTTFKNEVAPQSTFKFTQVHSKSEVTIADKDSAKKSSPASIATAIAPPSKPLAMTEKEQKLQVKMEALRKSREQRAQKAAAKGDTSISNPTVPPSLPVRGAERPDSKPQPHISSSTITIPVSNAASVGNLISGHVPAIPGLFLAPSSTNPPSISTAPGAMSASVTGSQRKRPVAADFDTPISVPTPKRPFGQSRYEAPLVINVTDEELDSDDEDVAMDLESSVDHNSPVLSSRKVSDPRNVTQNIAVLTNVPGRKPFTPPPVSSVSSTPTGRKSTLGNPEVLQEKEIAIEALRRKIAEAEAAKALKKARKFVDRTSTPRTTDSSSDEAKAMGNMAKNIETSIQIQQKINSAEAKVSIDQKRLADAQAAEVEKLAELKKSEAHQKRLRREQIATELPRMDAEVQRNQVRLETLRSEMATIEAAVMQDLAEKQKMADELEKLGQDAEDRLQAEKDKLQNLTSAESGGVSDSSGQAQSFAAEIDNQQPSLPVPDQSQPLGRTLSGLDYAPTLSDIKQANSQALPTISSFGPPLDTFQLESALVQQSDVTCRMESQSASNNQFPGSGVQDAENAKVASILHGQGDKNIESPPTISQSQPESVSSPMEVDSRSPSYSPVLERTITTASERDDDYEPPGATPIATGSPPFSPAPPEAVSGDILENIHAALAPVSNVDLAEETLLQTDSQVTPSQNEDDTQLTKPTRGFIPYSSPLKYFQAFRFHPEFGREVSGGLRSLTYSHKIDPMIEMCPWETAGGACNDKTCEYQHVRDIRLPDDDILSVLGSEYGFIGEQQSRFVGGLADALGSIRKNSIRDFDIIAQEILAYRRRFLGDDSKVLALEGTTI